MSDATIHYRGVGPARRKLAALPSVGAYILDQAPSGRVWKVAAVVFDGNTVNVYAVEVSPRLAGELMTAWATWDEATEQPSPT